MYPLCYLKLTIIVQKNSIHFSRKLCAFLNAYLLLYYWVTLAFVRGARNRVSLGTATAEQYSETDVLTVTSANL